MVTNSSDYTVSLERVFHGPMDLLLHLVREHEMDIHEIELSRILTGYLAYIESLDKLDVEFAGDFLVMAATLMAIKSRSLLPAEEIDLDEELDPRDELIQRLVEYRRFKDVADQLDLAWKQRESQAERGYFPETGDQRPEPEYDLGELTAFDLAAVFARLRRETLADRPHHIVSDPRPLRFYVEHVVDRLRTIRQGSLPELIETFGDVPRREALVGSFCALLELVRMQLVSVEQQEVTDQIHIALREEGAEQIDELLAEALFEGEREGDGEGEAIPAAEPPSSHEGNGGEAVEEPADLHEPNA